MIDKNTIKIESWKSGQALTNLEIILILTTLTTFYMSCVTCDGHLNSRSRDNNLISGKHVSFKKKFKFLKYLIYYKDSPSSE